MVFITGVVGDLSNVIIQCPSSISNSIFQWDLEIISLNGFFNNGAVHLHITFSDEKFNVYVGHLEAGTVFKKGVQLFLTSFEINIQNILNENYDKNIKK